MQPDNSLADKSEAKADVIVVSGFLGAGKTTLMKRLLSSRPDMSDTVVIVNEFGEIGIDASLLEDENTEMVELTSGCICCTLLTDLTLALNKVIDRFHPRWILIEASGVADPRNIMAALSQDSLTGKLAGCRTITVLDADCWEMRSIFGDLFRLQLQAADLLLMNKVDLLPPEKVRTCLREIRSALPRTQIVPTIHCHIDQDLIWFQPETWGAEIGPADRLPVTLNRYAELHEHDRDEPAAGHFVTFSFQEDRPVDEGCFKRFLEALPAEVFRVKGTVRFPDRTMLLNFVAGRAEWRPWPGEPVNRLVFVGWETTEENTLEPLRPCLA